MVRKSLFSFQLNHSECLEILERGIEYNLRNPSERAIQTQKSKTAGHFIEDFCNWNSNKVLDTILFDILGRSHFLHLEQSYHFLHLDFWPFSPPRPYYLTKYQNLHFGAFLRKYRFLHLFLEKIPNSPHVSILDDKYSQL